MTYNDAAIFHNAYRGNSLFHGGLYYSEEKLFDEWIAWHSGPDTTKEWVENELRKSGPIEIVGYADDPEAPPLREVGRRIVSVDELVKMMWEEYSYE